MSITNNLSKCDLLDEDFFCVLKAQKGFDENWKIIKKILRLRFLKKSEIINWKSIHKSKRLIFILLGFEPFKFSKFSLNFFSFLKTFD